MLIVEGHKAQEDDLLLLMPLRTLALLQAELPLKKSGGAGRRNSRREEKCAV